MTSSTKPEVLIKYLNTDNGGPSHGHRHRAKKRFGEVRLCGFSDMQADRQTDRLITVYLAPLPRARKFLLRTAMTVSLRWIRFGFDLNAGGASFRAIGIIIRLQRTADRARSATIRSNAWSDLHQPITKAGQILKFVLVYSLMATF